MEYAVDSKVKPKKNLGTGKSKQKSADPDQTAP